MCNVWIYKITHLPPVDGHDEKVLKADASSRVEKREEEASVTIQWSQSFSVRSPLCPAIKMTWLHLNRQQATSVLSLGRYVLLYELRNVKATLPVAGVTTSIGFASNLVLSVQSVPRCVQWTRKQPGSAVCSSRSRRTEILSTRVVRCNGMEFVSCLLLADKT